MIVYKNINNNINLYYYIESYNIICRHLVHVNKFIFWYIVVITLYTCYYYILQVLFV